MSRAWRENVISGFATMLLNYNVGPETAWRIAERLSAQGLETQGLAERSVQLFLLFPIAGAVAISGCASKDDDLDLSAYVDTIEPADVLYNQALANLNSGRLDEAAKKFDAVDRQHPYSEFARKSLVMGAFANYRSGKYDDAIAMTEALYCPLPDAARSCICLLYNRPFLLPANSGHYARAEHDPQVDCRVSRGRANLS